VAESFTFRFYFLKVSGKRASPVGQSPQQSVQSWRRGAPGLRHALCLQHMSGDTM
jgi:hypothetical protein